MTSCLVLKACKTHAVTKGKDKRSNLNKEPEVSNKQGDLAKRVKVSNEKEV